jgi:large subunit ribosomal protein L25
MVQILAERRTTFGKAVRKLRAEGFVPAELYGRGIENEHLAVSAKEFDRVFCEAGESTVIDVVIGDERRTALIHSVAVDPVTDEILNVDFYQVRPDEKVRVEIPLEFVGEPPAVSEHGGVFVKAVQSVEVEALPAEVPHSIAVDVASIGNVGESIHVRDLSVPSGVRVLSDPDTVVAIVTEQKVEAESAEAPEASIDTIEVEKKGERSERTTGREAESESAAAE